MHTANPLSTAKMTLLHFLYYFLFIIFTKVTKSPFTFGYAGSEVFFVLSCCPTNFVFALTLVQLECKFKIIAGTERPALPTIMKILAIINNYWTRLSKTS